MQYKLIRLKSKPKRNFTAGMTLRNLVALKNKLRVVASKMSPEFRVSKIEITPGTFKVYWYDRKMK